MLHALPQNHVFVARKKVKMIAKEDENDNEVRREDQDRINQFARLNARLQENKYEREQIKKELEGLDDACTELMMGPSTNDDDDDDIMGGTKASSTPSIMILQGETFFETNEDDATTFCEARIEKLQKQLDQLNDEDQDILSQQAELKKLLYGRFGKSINLEAD